MPNRRHPRLRLSRRLKALNVLDYGPQQCIRLQPGQDSANAPMHAIAPPQVPTVVPLDVESVWFGPLAWITVCSGEHQAAALALGNDDALDFDSRME
jgi:hypothetical protein